MMDGLVHHILACTWPFGCGGVRAGRKTRFVSFAGTLPPSVKSMGITAFIVY